MRECLKRIPDGSRLQFRMRYRDEPVLEMMELVVPGESTSAPPCARELLATIPVPREIFFQSNEEGALECYSSRLSLESEKIVGAPWPLSRTLLSVDFPLEVMPEDDAKTWVLLQTWALRPFFSAEGNGRQISARVVPAALCKACMGEKNLYDSESLPPPHWPE